MLLNSTIDGKFKVSGCDNQNVGETDHLTFSLFVGQGGLLYSVFNKLSDRTFMDLVKSKSTKIVKLFPSQLCYIAELKLISAYAYKFQ